MALRNIIKLGEPLLRMVSNEVTEFDSKLHTLLDDMYATMRTANGAGIAAPQVGILKRAVIISIDDGANVYELINPKIIKTSGIQCGYEGCLSIPGQQMQVERPKKVTVSAFDRYGKPITLKASGYLAVAFCHEIDHLDGILFIDKIKKD